MDQRLRAVMRAQIRRIHNELKLTTIYVTHDQAEAVSLCDRLLVMNHATLQQVGSVEEIWNRPANKFVATFVGEPQMNFIDATLEDRSSVAVAMGQGKVVLPVNGLVPEKYVGRPITLGVRPQEIDLAMEACRTGLPASVDLVEFQGENAVLTLKLEDRNRTEVSVAVLGDKLGQIGERVFICFREDKIHLFDEETPIFNGQTI
jgi:multiple sugar transport system ATP-binding protein